MDDEPIKKKIEESESRLYKTGQSGVNPRRKKRASLATSHRTVPRSWTAQERSSPRKQKSLPSSLFKKMFFISLSFFIFAAAVGVILFVGGSTTVSNEKIDIELLGRAFADGGEPLDLQVVVTNRNAANLELADLVISYPESSRVDSPVTRIRRSLETVQSGRSQTEDVSLVLFGEEGDIRTINARLEYRIAGSNAIFIRNATYDVTIQSSPVQMIVSAPTETIPNQTIEYRIHITSNSADPVENMLLELEYPFGFEFDSASPEPTYGTNKWAIGDLPANATRDIRVLGVLRGFEGDERAVRATLGRHTEQNKRDITTVFQTLVQSTRIRSAFLEALLVVNGQSGSATAKPGDRVRVDIAYRNTTPFTLRDVELSVDVSGPIFDPANIEGSSGFYDSNSRKIIWTKSNWPQFGSLAPGSAGDVSFTYRIPQNISLTINNPTLEMSTSMSARDENNKLLSGDFVDSASVRIGSILQLISKATHYSGAITNSGPMPPQAGQTTSYTINWQLSNTVNDANNVVVKTTLPPFVEWGGQWSPTNQNVTYDSSQRQVTWNVGTVNSNQTSNGPQVSFRVEITPSSSQVGTSASLTSTVSYSGKDAFTSNSLSGSKSALSTRILNDSSSIGIDGVVLP
ncbi:MAG: hypothetical protein OEX08_01685 [Candidatus Nomurabacteria bacterium]|nr:hypothetical protein [Candidatus Nomurabacteria bacterium]